MRSATCARCGLSIEACSISATIPAYRVSPPVRSTRTVTMPERLWLPAITPSPWRRSSGRDSPVSSASSTRLSPSVMAPSAGKTSPGSTRMRSPAASRRTGTRRNSPVSSCRSMVWGSRRISASRAPAVRSRSRCSSRRPDSRKKTNIVTESYQTSWPSGPVGSNVVTVLAPKAIRMPSATGTSMPARRLRRSRHAAVKNGQQEKRTTGSVSTQDAQRSSAAMSGVMSPGPAM